MFFYTSNNTYTMILYIYLSHFNYFDNNFFFSFLNTPNISPSKFKSDTFSQWFWMW